MHSPKQKMDSTSDILAKQLAGAHGDGHTRTVLGSIPMAGMRDLLLVAGAKLPLEWKLAAQIAHVEQ